MPLFKSKKSKANLAADSYAGAAHHYNGSNGHTYAGRSDVPAYSLPDQRQKQQQQQSRQQQQPQQQHQAGLSVVTSAVDPLLADTKPIQHGANVSKTQLDVGGLPVNVFGLDELTPSTSRALRPRLPDVAVVIHMHGRGGSADNEERIVRHLWDSAQRASASANQRQGPGQQQRRLKRRQQATAESSNGHESNEDDARELLLVSFDARNHGHRLTNPMGQKGWKQGNKMHALDLYSMIRGTAQDVSHLIDMLPAYLFPQSDRNVVEWGVTGKSLGGHSTWHVLVNDARVTVGVPFIGCPSFSNLLADRTKTSFVTNGPPYVPHALAELIKQTDPASSVAYWEHDPRTNPFYGKRICICSGAQDKLVPWRCGSEFVENLVVGPSRRPSDGLKVVLIDGAGHEVTDEMIEEAGHWINAWMR